MFKWKDKKRDIKDIRGIIKSRIRERKHSQGEKYYKVKKVIKVK